MLRVYLDQNKWIDLARAATGHSSGARYVDALNAARAAAAAGTASFPLDMFRYAETGKRANERSRNDVADVMIELSRQHTMALGRDILPAEVDGALKVRYGRPGQPRQVEVFGVGARHVTKEGVTWPELDESKLRAAAGDIPERHYPEIQKIYTRLIEEQVLRAGPEVVRAAGLNPDTRHIDQQYVDYENMIGSEIRARGLAGDMIDLAVRASDLGDIRTAVTEALNRVGLTWEEFLEDLGPGGVVGFMDDLPIRYVTNVMRSAKLRQAEQKWELNDFNDILALPVAAVYCDVVVTEAQWEHRLTQGKIEARYGTKVLRSVADLADILAASPN
ncbi:hypothetical protein MRBLWH7_000529 [Microbacterium sp. LWH7-1.2]|uniref:hypothetical protein n=1 Tax=Microbacterium sp. LWH7-1.2 TaxID=3135257 RepID=UPI00313877C8